MNLTQVKANVEHANNALNLARRETSTRRKDLKVAEEEESRRDILYKIAIDERDKAIRAAATA